MYIYLNKALPTFSLRFDLAIIENGNSLLDPQFRDTLFGVREFHYILHHHLLLLWHLSTARTPTC